MKKLILAVLACLIGFQAHAYLDTNLMQQAAAWKKGDAPMDRLLKFPDGKIDRSWQCGLRVWGSTVGDHICEIKNLDLLAALMFDAYATAETVGAAQTQLIKLKGPGYVAGLLAERRKAYAADPLRAELAVLQQLLQSPYISVQVASITKNDMEPKEALKVLEAMQSDLKAGVPWDEAYRRQYESHPDVRDRAQDLHSTRTLVSYRLDGTISPNGFDIQYCRTVEVDRGHLRELFQLKQGTHILKAPDGFYLYHVKSYYGGTGD